MSKLKDFGLYFITDSKLTKKTVLEDVKSAIKAGVKLIQYREKDASTKQMIEEAKEIIKLCGNSDVLFLVNDRVDVALAADADGIHIGQDDMHYDIARQLLGKNRIIGVTAHNVEEAAAAEKMVADYVGLSPIFETITKSDAGKACGPSMISKVKENIKIPLVAIGGINESNIDEVLGGGAKNIAIISAIIGKDDVEMAAKQFIDRIDSFK